MSTDPGSPFSFSPTVSHLYGESLYVASKYYLMGMKGFFPTPRYVLKRLMFGNKMKNLEKRYETNNL